MRNLLGPWIWRLPRPGATLGFALADRRRKDACCERGVASAGKAMHSDPRFWAVVVAFWIGFFLSVVNIATKIDLFMRLSG
jgi:hypothetical protein